MDDGRAGAIECHGGGREGSACLRRCTVKGGEQRSTDGLGVRAADGQNSLKGDEPVSLVFIHGLDLAGAW